MALLQSRDAEIENLYQRLSTSRIETEKEEKKAKSLKALNTRISEELSVMRTHFEREGAALKEQRSLALPRSTQS